MAWVRPVYHRDVWPDGDNRRLINLDHYRIVRVTSGDFGPHGQSGWAVEAITETMDRSASTSEIQGRTALLAAVRSEALATHLFEQVQQALATGVPVLDLQAAAEGV
jgi:hypothetical protein